MQGQVYMDKLEAIQRVLRFSESVRNWCENDEKVFFDDFDDQNVSAKIRLLNGFPEYFSDTFHNTLHGLKKLG
jgi:hypothetical protein